MTVGMMKFIGLAPREILFATDWIKGCMIRGEGLGFGLGNLSTSLYRFYSECGSIHRGILWCRIMSSPLNIFIGELEQLRKTSALPLAVIVGPTASGKTGASIALAKAIGERGVAVEIINADSRQCYKELDIGTAKITEEEMQGIPHHLFDALDPRTPITVAWYQKRAKEIIYEIQKRGALPVLVGGSMLFISAVIDGLALAPPGDPTLRKKLESDYDLDGGLTLYKKLQQIDPEAAAAFHANNKQYVVRAME